MQQRPVTGSGNEVEMVFPLHRPPVAEVQEWRSLKRVGEETAVYYHR